MAVKRILKVYYDLPNYLNPKEVVKVFKLMEERGKLMNQIHVAIRSDKKADLQDKLDAVESGLKMIANVITPKGANWGVATHEAIVGKHNNLTKFLVLTITEPVTESIFDKGQDDD